MKFCCITQDKGDRDPLLIKGYWVLTEWHMYTSRLGESKSQLWNHTNHTCFCKSTTLKKERCFCLKTSYPSLLSFTQTHLLKILKQPKHPTGSWHCANWRVHLLVMLVFFKNHMTSSVAMKMVEMPLGRQVLGAELTFFSGSNSCWDERVLFAFRVGLCAEPSVSWWWKQEEALV